MRPSGIAGTAPLGDRHAAEPENAPRLPAWGRPGLSALEAHIREAARAAAQLGAGATIESPGARGTAAPRTAAAVLAVLTRKGLPLRAGRTFASRCRLARPLALHIARITRRRLDRGPAHPAGLTITAIAEDPVARAGARVAVFYDGYWFEHLVSYLVHDRGEVLSVAGLHDVIRWHAAGIYGCPVRQVTLTGAHYVAGSDQFSSWLAEEMADNGVARHEVPVTAAKGEVGADVELALACYQLATETQVDMIALIAGDGDFAPLATRLAGRGTRVLVPVTNYRYPRSGDGVAEAVLTSTWLTRRATDTPALADLLETAENGGYPPFLARPFPPAGSGQAVRPGRRRGTVISWAAGAPFGLIRCDEGRTWFASTLQTPRHAALPPGCPVTFSGDPEPPRGKAHPPARAILPAATLHDGQPPGGQAAPAPRAGGSEAHPR